ncbi:MAG: GNAT family N-acetyltransferase [Candidatus Dormibacteraeota bacterium]|nr:GNAT family N-acetyltransferase [Candidatus Dormibacteraeota bacterium]
MIRPAHLDDALAIARVNVETWRATYGGIIPQDYLDGLTAADRVGVFAQRLARPEPGVTALVAETEAGVVGYATAGPERGGAPPGYPGEVYALYVLPEHQGRGLGRALMLAAAAALAAAGMAGLVIWVAWENHSARAFYERLGGRLLAERRQAVVGFEVREAGYGWQDPENVLLPADVPHYSG